MGIRYYAYPINAAEYPRALVEPCPFHSFDPLMDAWGPTDSKPEMLYLDKCWNEFQVLLSTPQGEPPRPAFQLVDGHVTHTGTGWIPYERALSPGQVRAISTDLENVGESEIRNLVSDSRNRFYSRDGDFEYIAHYLADAKEFTTRLASDGRGLVYLIG